MRILTFVFAFVFASNLHAQIGENLVTHISFNKNGCSIEDEAGDPSIEFFRLGDSICGCGVAGYSRYFDGDDDWFLLYGERVENAFTTIDFSLSFYFKPTSIAAGNQVLFSKKSGCNDETAFAVRFNPGNRSMTVELAESATISASISKTLPLSCWYHVVVVRKGGTTQLYVNKQKMGEVNSPGVLRVNINNSGTLTVGGSNNCSLEQQFVGYMDEIRLYNRAISFQDVEDLYLSPNQILTGLKPTGVNDTSIFIGGSVPIQLTGYCPTTFDWSPVANVVDPNIPDPIISPDMAGTYVYLVTMTDADNCHSYDSIRISVYDPKTISCNDILLPTAFTPNGDGLNDKFGISNPFLTGEILEFDIYDRWGNIVFETTDPLEKWDANYKGQAVNPGVFLYKIHYRCEGKENVRSGSVTVLR